MFTDDAGTGWQPSLDDDHPWQQLVEYALLLCQTWHRGDFDRAGRPYAEHPIEVARRVYERTHDPAAQCAALLHDTIEDTVMPQELLQAFPECVQLAVLALSRGVDESANAYIGRVLADRLACQVKVHDIEHNFSPGRADAKILAKAELYAGWHKRVCARLGIDRSFCAVHPALVSACECSDCTTRTGVRRGAGERGISGYAAAGAAVHPV